MNVAVRDGKFDVVIAAGPRTETWPSIGVRTLSNLCADMGLTVGQFGGETVSVKGVIPLPGTGGLVLVEDIQKRIHRIHARAIIRMTSISKLPDPFPGWRSQGLIPLATAERFRKESEIRWDPTTVILGTGNRAFKFGSSLLNSGTPEVYCIENYAQWGAKRFAGWEVERRKFEMMGGKIIEAQPIQLMPKAPLLWQLRLQDSQGIRVLEVNRVVSAGPFKAIQQIREYPAGSLLFEFEQTALPLQRDDAEGWMLEEERGRLLATKIIKTLIVQLGPKREKLDRVFRRARSRLKHALEHREAPFTPSYQGKWIQNADSKKIRAFSGVPQKAHLHRPVASIECFEEIPCNLCESVCPTSAIQMGRSARTKNQIFDENACTACGLCITTCPSQSISLIEEKEHSFSSMTLAWHGSKPWAPGEFAILVNRRGENLGSARVVTATEEKPQRVQIQIPTHLVWEARSIKRGRPPKSYDETFIQSVDESASTAQKIEISLNGEKRLVRDRVPVSIALFEMGQGRPEDVLFCEDGSCGLCQISIDGANRLACQTRIHRGMAIRTQMGSLHPAGLSKDELETKRTKTNSDLCPCLEISREQVVKKLKQGNLRSAEAVLSVSKVGEGKCHGSLCLEAFKRVLQEEGLPMDHWVDWRFPWMDWTLTHN